MQFDRDTFFEQYRRNFGGVQPIQVKGLERLLWGYETYHGWWDSIPQIANSLAQVKHETAHTFLPVVEGYYFGDSKAPNFYVGNTERVRRFHKSLRYYPHIGMGDIQLTWAENYREQDGYIRRYFPELVQDFEQRTGKRFDLIGSPTQALDPKISFAIMTVGMHKGTFREGQTLDRYINAREIDHFGARNIVNGDRHYKNKQGEKIGNVIARDALRFTKILEASLRPDLQDADIDLFADSIGSTSTAIDPAGSQSDLPDGPAYHSVESPELAADGMLSSDAAGEGENAAFTQSVKETVETPDGSRTVEQSLSTPVGDPPDAAPKHFFSVEDWKPLAKRWVARIWAGVSGITLPASGGLGLAALSDTSNWYVYAIAAVVLFVIIGGIGILATIIVVAIWLWHNRGIPAIKQTQMQILADPNLKNVGLEFVKK